MKQNDAVVMAVRATLDQQIFAAPVELTKEQREKVVGMVTEGIIAGSIDFSAEAREKHDTPAKVKAYVGGMVSNHLRKDKRLNGGEKYIIKNPGSRKKIDPTIQALQQLQEGYDAESEEWHKIAAAIYDRETELAKAKETIIDISALPEEFRHLVKKNTDK